MIIAVMLTSLALLYLPVVIRALGRRMEARRWYRAVVVSLFTGAVGLYVSVVSLALPEVFRFLGADRLRASATSSSVIYPTAAGWLAGSHSRLL